MARQNRKNNWKIIKKTNKHLYLVFKAKFSNLMLLEMIYSWIRRTSSSDFLLSSFNLSARHERRHKSLFLILLDSKKFISCVWVKEGTVKGVFNSLCRLLIHQEKLKSKWQLKKYIYIYINDYCHYFKTPPAHSSFLLLLTI